MSAATATADKGGHVLQFWPFLYAAPMLASALAKAGKWAAVHTLVGFMFSAGSGIAIAFSERIPFSGPLPLLS
jgi:hypothetical protein